MSAQRTLDSFAELLACPACSGALIRSADAFTCGSCAHRYALRDGRIFFVEPPTNYESKGDGEGGSTPDPTTWSSWRKHNYDYYARVLGALPEQGTAVDIGAGPGQFDEIFTRFAKLVSIDFRDYAPVTVVADLTSKLPLKDASADVVISSNTFEHLPDTVATFADIFRVLKSGGALVATMPFMMRIHQKPYDFNRYTHYQVRRLLEHAGFKDIEIEALSLPVEVYATAERHFYTYLKQAMGKRGRFHALLATLLWRLVWLERKLTVNLFLTIPPTLDYTEGYGFKAVKH